MRSLSSFVNTIILSGLLVSTPSIACDLRLAELDNMHTVMDHDMMTKSDRGATQSETFKVINNGSVCKFFVTVDGYTDVRQLYDQYTNRMDYYIYDSIQGTNVIKGLPNISEQNIITGEFTTNKNEVSLRYYFNAPYNEILPAGLYSDSVQVNLYEGDLSQYTLRDSQSVNFSVEVNTYINLEIQSDIGDSLSGIIDFTNIEPGKLKSASINVTTNTPYDMTIASENLSNMQHTYNQLDSSIPYSVIINNEYHELKTPLTIDFKKQNQSLTTQSHQLDFQISNFDFKLSGEYQDNIVITVSAR